MNQPQLTFTVASVFHDDLNWVHVVVVTLDGSEIQRDSLCLDQAGDRRRFIDELAAKLPAIMEGAEVSPEAIEKELIALAAKAATTNLDSAEGRRVAPGTQVRADDRENFGTVLDDLGHECLVRFVSPEGNIAEVELPKSQLRSLAGVPLLAAGMLVKPQEPFPVALLPSVVRQYVVEGAEARAADPSIVALPVLVTLAACIGTTRKIAPKRDWTAPAILWGAVVARSGSVKSVGYDLSHELLKAGEDADHLAHEEAKRDFRVAEAEHRKELQQWSKSKDAGPPPESPECPIARRLVVDDQTIEGIAPLLAENPRGLYLLIDELRGFFDGMGCYSSGGRGGRDEARWLTLFDSRPFNIDRKTNRERIYMPMAGVSVAGTIQPGTLAAVVCEGQVESGLLARLLLVMPEPRAKKWTDAEMTETTRLAMQGVVDQLKTLEHEIVDGLPKAVVLPLTDEAKKRFILFVNAHGRETIEHEDALAAAWSKLEGYALRFALVDHLVRWAAGDAGCDHAGPVGIASIEVGIELSRWFAAEAQRVYDRIGVTTNGSKAAGDRHHDRLAEWIASRGGSATEREIRRGPQRYRGEDGADHCETDCNALIQAGRARWETGRRTRQIVLIPLGDTGDGDTSPENTGNPSEVSPEGDSSVARGSATPVGADCDTFSENTAEIKEVSPSPVSPYPDPREQAGERVRMTI